MTNTLTTNFGARVPDNQHSVTAGERGPILLQDYFLKLPEIPVADL